MEFLVPQNLDIEDTIVGPITFKQALYLLGMAWWNDSQFIFDTL